MEVMRFAEKVRNLMKLRRLSQSELAELLGTNQPQISRWLESDTPPRWDYLLKMARALGVPADYLIDPAQDVPARASELSDDERYLVQLYRDLGLSREHAARALAAVARWSLPTGPRETGVPWVPGEVRDLRPSPPPPRRARDAHDSSAREPNRQDEGTDPEHSPGRLS
jgi:transcriptional regulator with XRE-family HTH domain